MAAHWDGVTPRAMVTCTNVLERAARNEAFAPFAATGDGVEERVLR